MDWRTVRFDWNRARAFLVTAEEGSLSAAARAMGMAQPTLGRQVDALEKELEVLLFDRVGRRLVLTPSGVELLEHVRVMGEAAGRMSMAASGQSQALEGSVSITASDMFASYLLPPVLRELREDHPGIHFEIVATNEVRDLTRREADIAIRNVRPEQPDLVARKVCDMEGHLYGASTYLDRLGRPGTPAGFSEADFVGFDRSDRFVQLLNSQGFPITQANFPYVTANQFVMWSLCKQGLALAVNAAPIGDADPQVERALPKMDPIKFPVWIASHRELHTSRRVRVVFDRLAERLAAS